jgi:hypothetical protein
MAVNSVYFARPNQGGRQVPIHKRLTIGAAAIAAAGVPLKLVGGLLVACVGVTGAALENVAGISTAPQAAGDQALIIVADKETEFDFHTSLTAAGTNCLPGVGVDWNATTGIVNTVTYPFMKVTENLAAGGALRTVDGSKAIRGVFAQTAF